MSDLITLSVIKADIGGYVGHSSIHPEIMAAAKSAVEGAVERGLLTDGYVTRCGDDLELIMTHTRGQDAPEIHEFAWNLFLAGTEIAKKLKQYGAGQDLLKDTFSGNVQGMGPGVAAMDFVERPSEPVIVFMADKTSPGAWNQPLCQIYANPFNTAGLVIDPALHQGFTFEVLDVFEHKSIRFDCPEDYYDLLMFIGAPRVIAAGFQIANGKLLGPRDLFHDPAFDRARARANEVADYLRAHGPFEPHRLGLDDMEYTTMPALMKKLEGRWKEEQTPGEEAGRKPEAAE